MRIKGLRAFAVDLPLKRGTYTMSSGRTAAGYVSTVVQIKTDAGITGYGEACTQGSNYLEGFAGGLQAAVRELAEVIVGLDPRETGVLNAQMDAAMIGQVVAKSPIDIACWDIKGQALGVPVSTLLGGRFNDTVPIFDAVSLGTPEAMASYAVSLRDLGFRNYQLKLGDDPAEDLARVKAVVDALGTWDFMTCDANAGWTRAQAMEMVRCLQKYDVFIEQPCRTIEELADVRARTQMPMIACEVVTSVPAVIDLVRCHAADAINLKTTRVGGLTKASQIRDLAQVLGLPMLVDEPMGTDLAGAAILSLAGSTMSKYLLAAAATATVSEVSLAGDSMPRVANGRCKIPEAPGLGITIHESRLGQPILEVGDCD